MNSRRVIDNITKTDDRLQILRELRHSPASPSELAKQYPVSRSPIYDAAESLEDWNAVVSIDGRRHLTAAGDAAVREAEVACETLSREQVSYLATSNANNRIRILRVLTKGSVRKAELQRDDDLPSRSTIDRAFDTYEQFGWITESSPYELTAAGEQAVATYNHLERTIALVLEKAAYLRHVDPALIELPIHLLVDGDIERSTPAHPQRTDEIIRDRLREGFDHCRLFSSYYSKEGVTAINEQLDTGASWAAVTPLPAHTDLPTSSTEIHHLIQGIRSPAIDWRIHSGPLPIDMSIYDDEEVILGSSPSALVETAPGDAILRSENNELIEWAIDLFEEYQSTAYPAWDRLDGPLAHADLKDLRRLVQDRIPGYAESDC